MKIKPIIIVPGEPKSIFFEIFFKALKKDNKFLTPLILIGSYKILQKQMNKLKFNKKINLLNIKDLGNYNLNNKFINLIDVEFSYRKSNRDLKFSNLYIKNCFNVAFKILKSGYTYKFINGPINKNKFLKKKYLGITEYIAKNFQIKKFGMLIYNENLSVSPLTTHLPLKQISKKINKNLIKKQVVLIDSFYKKNKGFKPKIALTGLNPHCESIHRFNEDIKIIKPTVSYLKNLGFKVFGPFAADTIFLKNNRKKYDVILGMYHDQVLSPFKTLFEYDAFNITLGLPFLRVSPDHGPNEKMIGKNLSSPLSLIKAIKFLEKS